MVISLQGVIEEAEAYQPLVAKVFIQHGAKACIELAAEAFIQHEAKPSQNVKQKPSSDSSHLRFIPRVLIQLPHASKHASIILASSKSFIFGFSKLGAILLSFMSHMNNLCSEVSSPQD